MIRSLVITICVLCVTTLMSEMLWIGLLWYRGQLNGSAMQEIRAVLSGRNEDASDVDQGSETFAISYEDVDKARTMRILELTTRENELAILKSLVDRKALELIGEQDHLEGVKKEFESHLAQIGAANTSEATEQTRAILLKMEPYDAVDYLMQLDRAEDIRILKGMAEKDIANILQAFTADPQRVDRGREIFEALSRGEPEKDLVKSTAEKTAPPGVTPES